MKILLDVNDNKAAFAMEFFKNVPFINTAKAITPNEITNPAILQSINSYEKGNVKPAPISLKEIKDLIHA